MSFVTMVKSLEGEVPGTNDGLIRNKINEALGYIYDETDWSFQTDQSAFLTSAAVTTGTVTATVGSTTITCDTGASAALLPLNTAGTLTKMQFRNPAYSLYSIVSANVSVPTAIVLTLDRVWMEPVSGAGLQYMVYQAYFPVPVQDFRKFIEIRDTTNEAAVSAVKIGQTDLAAIDPTRLQFGPAVPTYFVPWGIDRRTGSPTLNYMLYEIWPHVLADNAYTFTYKRRGSLLVNNTDTVQYPITEEALMWRAKQVLYLWKEAQKGDQMQRGSGADWRFLAGEAMTEYKAAVKKCRSVDANLHRDFLTRQTSPGAGQNYDGYSNMRTGSLNIGRF